MLRIDHVAASWTVAEAAAEARSIAAGWWLELNEGGPAMERLEQSGPPQEAEQLARRAGALREAAEELRLYE